MSQYLLLYKTKNYSLMKTIFISAFLATFLAISSQAQVVRASLLTGVGINAGSNSAGVTWHILDVSYAPKPNFDGGMYFDIGAGGSASTDGSGSLKAGAMYGVQGKYYFLTNTFKPFVGLQMGLQSGGSASTDVDGFIEEVDAKTKFQVTPQAGFRVGPLNIWTSYRTGWGLGFHGGLVWGFGNFKR